MRGADRICDEDLWQGTAKSAEGHLSQVLWAKAKEKGMDIAVNTSVNYLSTCTTPLNGN